MKKLKLNTEKLQLKKEIIANLTDPQMKIIIGGTGTCVGGCNNYTQPCTTQLTIEPNCLSNYCTQGCSQGGSCGCTDDLACTNTCSAGVMCSLEGGFCTCTA